MCPKDYNCGAESNKHDSCKSCKKQTVQHFGAKFPGFSKFFFYWFIFGFYTGCRK